MKLSEDSEESLRMQNNLFNLLNSNDNRNVILGVQILWNLEIPEELVAFLFDKKENNPDIEQLLRKHFPKETYHLAYEWFELAWHLREKKIELLTKLPHLHKGFDWQYLLPLYTKSYERWGRPFEYKNNNMVSQLFNEKTVPKQQLISLCIDSKNVLDLSNQQIDELPKEIGDFPQLRGIRTHNLIVHLPFSILKLNNLQFLDLGESSHLSKIYGLECSIEEEKDIELKQQHQALLEEEIKKSNFY